jgi:hypothetical protein
MSQPGRRKGVNLTEELKELLLKREARWTPFTKLAEKFSPEYTEDQVRNAIYNLTERHGLSREGRGAKARFRFNPKAVKAEIGTVIHEQVEAYIASSPSADDRAAQVRNELPQVALDVRQSQIMDDPELTGEPEGTFKIIGNLIDDFQLNHEFVGTVVRITSPGFSDRPYLLKEL